MALTRKWYPSPNKSGRGGSAVRCIVLHTTEGAQTIGDLGNFFKSSSVQASSHVGADNVTRGVIGEYVARADKAWTQGNGNPYCISCEICTPSGAAANWSDATWRSKPILLENIAAWIAEEAKYYGIPIVKLTASQAQGSGRGVCQHRDGGSAWGGHSDCGNGFPIDYVLQLAKGGSGASAAAEEEDMAVSAAYWKGELYLAGIWKDGRVCVKLPGDMWRAVDEASKAKSGASIAITDAGLITVGYVNMGGKACTYDKQPGGSKWAWADRGGELR
jgi:hypothetical protein